MIEEKQGRFRSTRTASEYEELLKREMATLSPAEREALEIMLAEMEQGDPELMKALGQLEYKHTPVDMRTFITDPYYLGHTCDNLYPKLLEDEIALFEGGYHEAILTGSIGWGKTFFASIGICRLLYELSCMKDPHKSFGLAVGSNISVVNLSVSEELAIKVVFENIEAKIKASPYFQEHFPYEAVKKELRFPNGIWCAARASTDTSVLGLNVIGGIIDETNFMPKKLQQKASNARWGHYDQAESLYVALKRRMKSRFEKHGRLPGLLFLVSSKKTVDDFTAKRIRESKDDPTIYVRDYALWDVKPNSFYDDKKFYVFVGNYQTPSRILAEGEEKKYQGDAIPEGCAVVTVPEDFRFDFERDLEGAIRDIAGVATVAVHPFINRRETIEAAIDKSRKHPFTSETLDPSKGGQFIWSEMTQERTERAFGQTQKQVRPIINPTTLRHVHIDPSRVGDSTGLCMAHIAGWKDVVRRADDGREFSERAPIYIVDVLLRIVPPVGGEIIFGDVRRLIYDFVAHGYSIAMVTYDSWQTVDGLQQLQQKGFRAEMLSVDTRLDPYENLKSALYENRVYYYRYEPLLDELRKLEKNEERKKVDHPIKGSKDVADALAGCLFTLSQNRSAQPVPIVKGLTYDDSEWMPEQKQYVTPAGGFGTPGSGPLPPFLVGSGGDDWRGGWNPGSL